MHIDADLNGGIFLQNLPDRRFHTFISPCDLSFAIDLVVHPIMVEDFNAVLFFQQLLQIFPCPPDAFFFPLRHVTIGKAFGNMGMENEHLWTIHICIYGEVLCQSVIDVDVRRQQHGTGIGGVISFLEIGKILHALHFFPGQIGGCHLFLLLELQIINAEKPRFFGRLLRCFPFSCGVCTFLPCGLCRRYLSRQNLPHGKSRAAHGPEHRQRQQKHTNAQQIPAQEPLILFFLPHGRNLLSVCK